MEVRLRGTLKELESTVDSIKQNYEVLSVSKPYKDRNSELYRVYIEMELKDNG